MACPVNSSKIYNLSQVYDIPWVLYCEAMVFKLI